MALLMKGVIGVGSWKARFCLGYVTCSVSCLQQIEMVGSGSVAQSRLTLYDPMDCSTPGLSVLYYLPEFPQIHVYWVNDAIQPSHLCHPLLLLPSLFPSISVFSSELAGVISLQSKGLSRVFSSTTVQKHQFFGTQPSLWSNSHICTWLLEKP